MIASPEAAFVCIGNEILSGKTRDSNLQVLAQWLGRQGVRLAEARVIADRESHIVATVRELKTRYDYVITSGGIGPTHDDITSESIATAFDVSVVLDKQALKPLIDYFGESGLTESRKKMARIPKGSCTIRNPVSGAVGFYMENVFVLAGVPSIFKAMLEDMTELISGGDLWHSTSLEVYSGESQIADQLQQIQHSHEQIEIGSYPKYDPQRKYYTELVFSSQDEQAIANAVERTIAMLRENNIEFIRQAEREQG